MGYDIAPLKRVKLKILTTSHQTLEKYRNPHGQLKENLFLPLFNTNLITRGLHIFPPLVQRVIIGEIYIHLYTHKNLLSDTPKKTGIDSF